MDGRFRNAGRSVGACIVRIKPFFQLIFFVLMIVYECYDCVSDAMNVYQYSEGDSVDLSMRNENVYRAFFFSLIISILCAISSCAGYVFLIVGLSKSLQEHAKEKNNTFKLGRLIVFISLFCQVCLEESIQSIILYNYIIKCSVIYSFWKISLFVCITFHLMYAGYTFFKGAHVWFKKQDSLPRKYPSCLVPCYSARPSVASCVAMCIFGMIMALGLFGLNIATLVTIIKNSEVDVPHLVASNDNGTIPAVKLLPVKDLVKSNGTVVTKLPCMVPGPGSQQSHFFGEQQLLNCSSVIFSFSLTKATKKLKYNVQYCYNSDHTCNAIKKTDVTVKFSHKLCSDHSPILSYLGPPGGVVGTKPILTLLGSTGDTVLAEPSELLVPGDVPIQNEQELPS